MGIYKYGNYYRVELYIGSQRVATKSGFKTKVEAKDWHDRQRILQSDNVGTKRIKLKFKELVDKFIGDYLNHSVKKSTKTRYMIDIKRMLEHFGPTSLEGIKAKNIQDFQNKLKVTKLSISSINHCMTILFSIFEKGILWDYCLTNPCKKVHRLKRNEKPYRWWKDRADIVKFLACIKNNHYFLFFKTALETGLRRGELVGLTWDCIDLTTGRVELYRQYDANNKFSSLKNNKCRTIWIPTETLPLFRQQKVQSKSEFVFTKPDGTPVCASAISEKTFKTFQKNAKVPIINFHGLRHTYASHYMFNGGDIYKLSKLLGHSGVEVTQKYAHLSEEALMSSRNRVVFNVDNISAIHTLFTHIEQDKEFKTKINVAI